VSVVETVHHSLRETGTFMPPAYGCSRHNVQSEEEVLNAVCSTPSTSTCWIACEIGLLVWHGIHFMRSSCALFHQQLMQGLQPGDRQSSCPVLSVASTHSFS
jgi:hypothetical protein